MSHELYRITEKLYNTPHLITSPSLDNIVNYLNDRNSGKADLAIMGSDYQDERDVCYNEDTGVGVISICGPLTYIAYSGLCGEEGVSYQSIQEEFEELLELGATTILLDIDSGGGEAFGCFETGEYLRAQADEAGVALISYVDGSACSAAYALACSAHEIILNPYGEAGSIGVVVKLRNVNKALQQMGVEDTYVFAGDAKIPFNADGEFTQEFIDDIQLSVNALYQDFVEFVSSMRQISPETVSNTKAKVFMADKAVTLGLADKIMTRQEFATYLADVVERKDNNMLKTKLFNLNNKKQELEMKKPSIEEIQASLEAVQAQLADSLEQKTTLEALMAAKEVEFSTLNTSLADALAQLSSLKDEAASAQAKAKEEKLSLRKEKLSKVLDAEQAEKTFAVLAEVDDAIFEMAFSGYASAAKAEKDNTAFKELGVNGDVTTAPTLDGTGSYLAKKYNKKQ